MKPPPCTLSCFLLALLEFILLWTRVQTGSAIYNPNEWKRFPLSNIHLREIQVGWLISTYLNHSDSPKVLLRCYQQYTSTRGVPIAVITNAINNDHIVTIEQFPCGSKEDLNKYTYMSHKDENGRKTLSVGILPSDYYGNRNSYNGWCQYDICYTCDDDNDKIKKITTSMTEPKLFQWSEDGILIDRKLEPYPTEYGSLTAEFISTGNEKFVLTCFKNGAVVIRSTEGYRIVVLTNLKCNPDEYINIQTFYILTAFKPDPITGKTENSKLYQLANPMETISWYDGKSSPSATHTLYYFSTSDNSQSKMCYWTPINHKPNTCPAITDKQIKLSSSYFYNILQTREIEVKAIYRKKNQLTLTYYETRKDPEKPMTPFIVVTGLLGVHIFSLESVPFTTIEEFSKYFYVDCDKAVCVYQAVFGSRQSLGDDWCTYNLLYLYPEMRKFIYYGYKPQPRAFEWEQVNNIYECTDELYIAVLPDYIEPTDEANTVKYLSPGEGTKISLIMNCFNSVVNNKDRKVNVIKKLNGETVVAIASDNCLAEMTYFVRLKVVNMKQNTYLVIGSKTVNVLDCQYSICLTCETKEINRIFKQFPETEYIEWTEAGVKWNHEPIAEVKGFAKGYIQQQYKTLGKTVFVLVCSYSSNKYQWLLRTASGIRIAVLPIDNTCDNSVEMSYYIYTKEAGGSKVYTGSDCYSAVCAVRPTAEVDVWFFITLKGNDFLVVGEETHNECNSVGYDYISFQEETSLNTEVINGNYWNGGTPRMTLNCYTNDGGYAVIKHNDKHVLTLKYSKSMDVQMCDKIVKDLYIHLEEGDAESGRVVVGTIGTRNWCHYGLDLSNKVLMGDPWVYFEYKDDISAEQWYKEGQCPELPKESILISQEDVGNTDDLGSLVTSYSSLSFGELKTLYCYQNDQNKESILSYTTLIKLLTEKLFVTVKGIDCSNLLEFSLKYFKTPEKKYLALWKKGTSDSENSGCRYDICMNCQDKEIFLHIDTTRMASSINWDKMLQVTPPDLDEDILSTKYNRVISVERTTVKEEDYENVNTFVSEGEKKLEVHCYLRKAITDADQPTFISVIMDESDQVLFKILDLDCSLQKKSRNVKFTAMYKKSDEYELYSLEVYEKKYIICPNCKTPFVSAIDGNVDLQDFFLFSWRIDEQTDCLGLKRDDISVDENQFQFDDSFEMKKYITSYETAHIGQYLLTCHSKTDGDKKTIANIRDVSTMKHVISINGIIDCSSGKPINNWFFLSIEKEEDKFMVYLGLKRGIFQCQYEVCTGSNACDPNMKLSYDVINEKNWFKWSMSGVKMALNSCPLPEIEGPCDQGQCNHLGEFWQSPRPQLFTLNCYKSFDGKVYYLTLRTMKGNYISTITLSEDCVNMKTTIERFYVLKQSKSKTVLFEMYQEDIMEVIESCWQKEDEEEVEIWFFYSLLKNNERNLWQRSLDEKKDCLSSGTISKNKIELMNQETEDPMTKTAFQYSNAGRIKAKLSCHSGSEPYVIINNNNNGQRLKIKDATCETLENLYVDIEDHLTIIGSRTEQFKNFMTSEVWCYLSIYSKGDSIQSRILNDYERKHTAGQWYEEQGAECSTIKREAIITDDSLKQSLDSEKPIAFYIVAVTTKDSGAILKQNLLNYICYSIKDDTGSDSSALVVTDLAGRHLVTVKYISCGPDSSLEQQFFAIPMKHPKYPTYLALGGRIPNCPKCDWCQYGICLDCETKEVMKSTSKRFANGYLQLAWTKSESMDCPAAKKNIFLKEDGLNLNDLTESSVHVLTVFDSMLNFNFYEFKMKEQFIIYCYFNEKDNTRKYTMVVRSSDGHHQVTVDDFDCSSKDFQQNIYLHTEKGNDENLLVLGTRASHKQSWCRYNICSTCTAMNIWRDFHFDKMSVADLVIYRKIFKWMPGFQVKYSSSKKDDTKVPLKPDKGAILWSTYKNGKFGIECYISMSENPFIIIVDENGKRVAKMEDIVLSTISNIEEKIKIFNSRFNSGEIGNDYLVGVPLDEAKEVCCMFSSCISCKKIANILKDMKPDDILKFGKVIDEYHAQIDIKVEWRKVKPEFCSALPKEDIYLNIIELNLENDKMVASYMNLNFNDEDTVIIFCYRHEDSNEDATIITRLRSLDKGFDIAIKNLDCQPTNNLFKWFYMTVVKDKSGAKNLILGFSKEIFPSMDLPWCSYELCISCDDRVISVSDMSYRDDLRTLHWSEPGQKIAVPGNPNSCGEHNVATLPITAKYVHMQHDNFNIECHGPSADSEAVCSMVRFQGESLVTVPNPGCMATTTQIQQLYILTSNKNMEHSLIRLGASLKEQETAKKDIHEQWFYFFKDSTKKLHWKKAIDSTVDSTDGKTNNKNDETNDDTVCLLKDRTWSDFNDRPFLEGETRSSSTVERSRRYGY